MAEERWEFPDIEKELAKRKADLARLKVNEQCETKPLSDFEIQFRSKLVDHNVDEANKKRYDENGLRDTQKFKSYPTLSQWKDGRLNIDNFPSIPTWRIVKNGNDENYIVRVGSETDLYFKQREEKNEK